MSASILRVCASTLLSAGVLLTMLVAAVSADAQERGRVRDFGIAPGVFEPGPLNAITDVAGVRIGQISLIEGDDVRTGATAILPHGGNLYQDKVPAAVVVGNGFGKVAGFTEVMELGQIEAPIVLTNTLSIAVATEAVIDWTLARPGNERVVTVNAVVGETNDGALNDIRKRALRSGDVIRAIEAAAEGPVEEGSVGAGTGTSAFGFKGGIGTSSRRLPDVYGGYSVGVLVQTNFGGLLTIEGVPINEALIRGLIERGAQPGRLPNAPYSEEDGSIMIVVATDAPLSDRNLERLARRALGGLARTGAGLTNESGDYVVAFSTAEGVRRTPERRAGLATIEELPNERLSPLFVATIWATEEAILNSLFMATTMEGQNAFTGRPNRVEALPIDQVLEMIGRRPPSQEQN